MSGLSLRNPSPSSRYVIVLVSLAPLPGRKRPVERALELLELIGTDGPDGRDSIPVAWNLPAADLAAAGDDTAAAVLQRIAERAQVCGDVLVPMGLTGAPNVALHADELAGEISWAASNIWHTGAADSTRSAPELLLPRSPDPYRSNALACYGASEVPVGMVGEASDGAWLSLVPNGGGAAERALPVLQLGSIAPESLTRRALSRMLRTRQRAARAVLHKDAGVIVQLGPQPAPEAELLLTLLSTLTEGRRSSSWSAAPLSPDAAASGGVPRLIAVQSPPADPARSRETSRMRRRRGSKINTRRILETLAGARTGADEESESASTHLHVPDEGRREFIASMMGEAVIPGTTMSACFTQGRLCGLHGEATRPATARPAQSFVVTAAGEHLTDGVESCFSFESELSRGLRSESVIAHETHGLAVRIRTEYSLVDEYDALVASQHVLESGGHTDDVLYVLAEPILRRDRCAITGYHTDGSVYDHEVSWQPGETTLWGEAFQIWDGESCYTLVPVTTDGRPMSWSISLLREPGPAVVLGGRYRLGRAGAPREHRISFLLVRGELDDHIVQRALAGRLPAAIVRELAAGTAAEISMAATSPAERSAAEKRSAEKRSAERQARQEA